ncbi:MAG: AMP-binding protein [Desulfobacterales bacterium]|nr:AMP-binding protein [Desulfobacterales bacterium]
MEAITYRSLGERIQATAKALLEEGIAEGDMVGIFSQNRPEWAIADFAILSIKAVSGSDLCNEHIKADRVHRARRGLEAHLRGRPGAVRQGEILHAHAKTAGQDRHVRQRPQSAGG